MGMFAKNGSYAEPGGSFPTAEMGTYLCAFEEVVQGTRDQSKFGKSAEEPCFRFKFLTFEAQDEEGYPFKFSKTCGTQYGNDKAALTILINDMLGRTQNLSYDDYQRLDIDHLKRVKYQVMVTEDEDKQTPGKYYNNIVTIRPVRTEPRQQRPGVGGQAAQGQQRRPAAPAPNVDDEGAMDGLSDPFAE